MHNLGEAELDTLIEEEKKRVAVDCFREAWDNAEAEGIEADILAESAIFTALCELARLHGEDALSRLAETLPDRIACGEFQPDRTFQ